MSDNIYDYLPKKKGFFPHYSFAECSDAAFDVLCAQACARAVPFWILSGLATLGAAITVYYQISILNLFSRVKWRFLFAVTGSPLYPFFIWLLVSKKARDAYDESVKKDKEKI